MFDEDDASLAKCPQCGYRLEFQLTNPGYVLKKSNRDLSATYEGQLIVSSAFRNHCLSESYPGLEFIDFKNDPKHFHLIVNRQVKFDAKRRKTRFEKPCSKCGNYESVVGATPCYLVQNESLGSGFYRTDLFFGSGHRKSPIALVGAETKMKLEKAGLKGLEFEAAYGIE